MILIMTKKLVGSYIELKISQILIEKTYNEILIIININYLFKIEIN